VAPAPPSFGVYIHGPVRAVRGGDAREGGRQPVNSLLAPMSIPLAGRLRG
jgi:hypothetical protein